ncbi:MAG: polysaccharide deacetylase family protein [Ignavibacterium sp.]|nr:polysaccharide deacetylase family protein [Ignavibacterium sp.]
MKYKYNPPSIIKKIFRSFYWNTVNNKILLTFDDGPISNITADILNILSKHKIKAIFFCVGENILRNISLTGEIIKEGHSIGNHTFNHQVLLNLTDYQKLKQIQKFNTLMLEKFNYQVKYFRPPHGKFDFTTKKALEKLKLKNVMWSLLTYDYKNNLELVKFAVKNFLTNNSIIVLHDSIKSKDIIKDSIEFIVDEVKRNNFTFGEPEECLK